MSGLIGVQLHPSQAVVASDLEYLLEEELEALRPRVWVSKRELVDTSEVESASSTPNYAARIQWPTSESALDPYDPSGPSQQPRRAAASVTQSSPSASINPRTY